MTELLALIGFGILFLLSGVGILLFTLVVFVVVVRFFAAVIEAFL